ncbi:LodA/GoxA family CTQ-dependent oxidase [Bradyrhizobium canariense]|uniref:Iron-containing redox enzyme n=1 Tax=Bradyrhizobium canariense TaxID=255045 RepID=A0A1H1XHX6_9BRAD|nr:LodA/GoxA family CTQ-dependent oxidase [Bradyrhizobium canariense]SDT08316.1 Iron-containing redox enzyme [Bradyrhizobium canariense]
MTTFRIHPAIGIARVGNSDGYVIAPETMAGSPPADGSKLTGGLPIRPGTASESIRSSDLRDASGALKRHAARFRLFSYKDSTSETWPRGDGDEVRIGDTVDGRKIADIIWTVHVANKKTNWFVLAEEDDKPQGIASYADGNLPDIRNPSLTQTGAPQPVDKLAVLALPDRLRKLVIDPGPRVISGKSADPVRFDAQTSAKYFDIARGATVEIPHYPKSFPCDELGQIESPSGLIDSLGELRTDSFGRLLVLGGRGRAVAWKIAGKSPLDDDVNNDQWFDDTSDGPVSATIVFDDGTRESAHGAWVTTTDPSFAPQILNVVSMWDDVYDVWVRQLELAPEIFDGSSEVYRETYKPTFDDQIAPILRSASQQHWIANLGQTGISAHAALAKITATTDPTGTSLAGLSAVFRDPSQNQTSNTTLMPLHLGDAGEAMLSLRKTQHFFLSQWNKGIGHFLAGAGSKLGPGEFLDKASLVNCIGGRLSPGIDLTFVMREPALYELPWKTSGGGPFRIRARALAYDANLVGDKAFLSVGYVPRHDDQLGLEPGDLSKFMALPWHTDYNSCATHPPDPAVPGNRTVFWSWPAQRPVAVYDASQLGWGPHSLDDSTNVFQLGPQLWSVRGWGTDAADAENWGRYQERKDMLYNWHRIGTVLQSPAIEPPIQHIEGDQQDITNAPEDWYLEVESQLRDTGRTPVTPFPNYATEITLPDTAQLGATPDSLNPNAVRELFYQLLNVDEYPGALRNARRYVEFWLKWAEAFSLNPAKASYDRMFFPFSAPALEARMQLIYQELSDDADAPDADPLFKTPADMVTRIKQFTPLNLLDGAWLRNIARTGPTDEVRALLFSIWMDEFGDGEVSKNHCNIYLDLCHSVGFYPPSLSSREFAFDTDFLDSAFTVPTFELAISQFTEDYYPEILGMTLQLEWEVLGLKPTRDLLVNFGLNPHFYVMHIGIDNAVNGHGRRALDAVLLYLQSIQEAGGSNGVAGAWRRIWNGYVAFGQIGSFGSDLYNLIKNPSSLKQRMIEMIKSKADFGSRNHQTHTLGGMPINELFAVPEQFLNIMVTSGLLTPGDWENSRLNQLIQFQTGPMFRVFTDDEIALLSDYTLSLSSPPKPTPPKGLPAAAAMEAVINQLKPQQVGTAGHTAHSLKDDSGIDHTVSWWFDQSPRTFMKALALPLNNFISPGNPAASAFFTHWIAPGGPMGNVFDAAAVASPGMTCRAVVERWITKGCPLTDEVIRMLRLTTPSTKRARHRTGRLYGMGSVH